MEKEFSLESIFSIISGYNFCKDFDNVYQVFKFVYNDSTLKAHELINLRDDLVNYILSIYPEFSNINYINDLEFIEEQKKIYGSKIKLKRIRKSYVKRKQFG